MLMKEKEVNHYLEQINYEIMDKGGYIHIISDLKCVNNKGKDTKVGELQIYLFEEEREDINIAGDLIDRVTFDTIQNFNIIERWEGYSMDQKDKSPFSKIPFSIWGRVAVIDRLYIFPSFRNMNFGTESLTSTIQFLKDILNTEFIILKAYPIWNSLNGGSQEPKLNENEINKRIKKLVNYYEKFGFKTYRKKDNEVYQCKRLL